MQVLQMCRYVILMLERRKLTKTISFFLKRRHYKTLITSSVSLLILNLRGGFNANFTT